MAANIEQVEQLDDPEFVPTGRKRTWLRVLFTPTALPAHLNVLTAVVFLAASLAGVRIMIVGEDSDLVYFLILSVPILLASLRFVLGLNWISQEKLRIVGPAVSLVGFGTAVLFILITPASQQNVHLLLIAIGVTSLLLPSQLLLILAFLGLLAWIPTQWLPIPVSFWVYMAVGLLVSASSRFNTELYRYDLQTKVDRLREQLKKEQEIAGWLQESKARYDDLLMSNRDMILELDSRAIVTSINPVFTTVTGWSAQDWIGKPFAALVDPKDIERCREGLHQSTTQGTLTHLELRLKSDSGDCRLADVQIISHQVADTRHQVGDITIIARDITDVRRIEQTLSETQERFALAAQGANDGLWDWDINNDYVYLSPRWKYMLGYEDNEIGTKPSEWFDRVHPQDLQRLKSALLGHMNGDGGHFENTFRLRHKNGSYRWVSSRGIAVRDKSGTANRIVGSQTDITRFKVTEEQLQHDAFHDPLTGLANRALFVDRLDQAIKKGKKNPSYNFALLFLDLDRFKVINDSLGHEAGDELLSVTAKRISSCSGPDDTVARLGGDEFTLLLDDIRNPADATRVAERIQTALATPYNLGGHEVYITASTGIAFSSTGYDRPADLLRDADLAMYRAKLMGKDRHEVFDHGMHTRAVKLLRLENDLRRAIGREEFRVHYQPIVLLKTGEISGFEALIRWQHPQEGLLSPCSFLNTAEETGMIIPIGWWVLHEACRQVKSWQDKFRLSPQLSVSVNLSPKNLSQSSVVFQVESALKSSGLSPGSLKLEITEGAIMEESSIQPFEKLKALGVDLYLDDLGSGYSSLQYLHRFPLDASKIDRSFISSMTTDSESAQIVEAMVTLSHTLGMKVIAEGVETVDQAARLRDLECEYGQGFLYSRALDAARAEKLMERIFAARAASRKAPERVVHFTRPSMLNAQG